MPIDSIAGAAAANPYLIWIAPGVYNERIDQGQWQGAIYRYGCHPHGISQQVIIQVVNSPSVNDPGASGIRLDHRIC